MRVDLILLFLPGETMHLQEIPMLGKSLFHSITTLVILRVNNRTLVIFTRDA